MKKRLIITKIFLLLISIILFSSVVYGEENIPTFRYSNDGWEQVNSSSHNVSISEVSMQEAYDFPSKYDLRHLNGRNYVTSVKNQGQLGTCWSFAAISVAETSALLKGANPSTNLSEKALAWYAYQTQGSKKMSEEEYEGCYNVSYSESWKYEMDTQLYNSGGNFDIIRSQLSTWNGTSTESEIPYCNSNGDYIELDTSSIPNLEGDWTLPYSDIYQNAYHLNEGFEVKKPKDKNEYINNIKKAMLNYGALYLSGGSTFEEPYYNPITAAQYYPEDSDYSHAVTIIGWDDTYATSNFQIEPPGPGAWIIKNSGGTDANDKGYYYISYYDATIKYVAVMDVETRGSGFTNDKNYQYDFEADRLSVCSELANSIVPNNKNLPNDLIKTANVFTTDTDETLRAVGITTTGNAVKATVNIYLLNENNQNPEDGILVETITKNDFEGKGFYNLSLNNPIQLPKGTSFSVVCSMYNSVELEDGSTINKPSFSVEYGLKEPIFETTVDDEDNVIGLRYTDYLAKAEPGQSYVYGLNGNIGQTTPEWKDITDSGIQNNLIKSAKFQDKVIECIPGNVMLKAFTTYGIDDTTIFPNDVSISPSDLYLSTSENGINSATVTAEITPISSNADLEWSVAPNSIAEIVGSSTGKSVEIKAISEGKATITLTTANELVATADVLVNNGI